MFLGEKVSAQGVPLPVWGWGRTIRFAIRVSDRCAQFCAHHQTLPRVTNCRTNRWKALLDMAFVALGHNSSHSVQVVDSSCGNGYEPEGREFESLRAHHS